MDITLEMRKEFEESVYVKTEDFDNHKEAKFYVNKKKMKTFVVNKDLEIIGYYPIELGKDLGLENDSIIEILTLKKDEIIHFLSKK